MRHVFILNPIAGQGRLIRALEEKIHQACQKAALDYSAVFTEHAGDAIRITRSLGSAGSPTRVYVCGGDGTLNEVVQAAAGVPHLAVTNIPCGTGNDFLKIFGQGHREGFSDILALAEGPQAPLDLIDCNGRLGLDIVCAGVDARVAADVHKYGRFPLVSGKGAYILALIANVLLKNIAQEMTVTMDGRTRSEPISLLCVCNGRYYGGGFMPVGDAMPDDGILDCLLVKKVSRLTLARLVKRYAVGGYAEFPQYITPYHGAGPVTVQSDTEITLVVDGEVMRSKEFTIRLSDKKVNFFYPAHLTWKAKPVEAQPEPATIGK